MTVEDELLRMGVVVQKTACGWKYSDWLRLRRSGNYWLIEFTHNKFVYIASVILDSGDRTLVYNTFIDYIEKPMTCLFKPSNNTATVALKNYAKEALSQFSRNEFLETIGQLAYQAYKEKYLFGEHVYDLYLVGDQIGVTGIEIDEVIYRVKRVVEASRELIA